MRETDNPVGDVGAGGTVGEKDAVGLLEPDSGKAEDAFFVEEAGGDGGLGGAGAGGGGALPWGEGGRGKL